MSRKEEERRRTRILIAKWNIAIHLDILLQEGNITWDQRKAIARILEEGE